MGHWQTRPRLLSEQPPPPFPREGVDHRRHRLGDGHEASIRITLADQRDTGVLRFVYSTVIAGRADRNDVAFSNASATWNTVASWNGLPTICNDNGNPAGPNPEQTDIAG